MHTRTRKLKRSQSSGVVGLNSSLHRSLSASVRANRMRSNSALSDGDGGGPQTPPTSVPKTATEDSKPINDDDDDEAQTERTSPSFVAEPRAKKCRGVGLFRSNASSSSRDANDSPSSSASSNKRSGRGGKLRRRKTCDPIDGVRLVKRDLGHYQSSNKLGIDYIGNDGDITALLRRDWFHFLLSMDTINSVLIFLSCWTFVIIVFAVAYHSYDRLDPQTNCGLGDAGRPIDFGPAFAFSLETCTTVGYGLPSGSNAFFESSCPGLEFLIYAQMVTSMMFNAFLFAFFFSRLARCEKRGLQVIFSNKAIVRQIRRKKMNDGDEDFDFFDLGKKTNEEEEEDQEEDDRWLFQTRLYDLNSRMPLVEAHVRLYLVSYEKQHRFREPVQVQPLRLIDPDDDKGAVLYPSVPVKITHHINATSPLNPRAHETITKKNITSFGLTHQFNNPDNMTPEFSNCPVCGQTFDTLNSLQRHVLYTAANEDCNERLPVSGTHRDESLVRDVLRKPSSPPPPPPPNFSKEELRDFLKGKEILCVLEGIEPMSSGTFQAIQSYKAEDIVFGQAYFEPCMIILPTVESRYNHAKGTVVVDMVKFHTVVDEEGGVARFVRPSSRSSPTNSRNNTRTDD